MKKLSLAMFAFVACALGALAQGFPTVSTADNAVWYLIQFVNGGNAITAENSGANITTKAVEGSDAQLWKVTGDATAGYQLTNKKGYTLHVASATKDQVVKASENPSGVSRFAIVASSGAFEIQPKGNDAISMNLTGGPKENRGVGLWNKGDQNNPVTFVDVARVEMMSKLPLIPFPQEIAMGEGSFAFSQLNAIAYGSDDMLEHVERFAEQLELVSGIKLEVKKAGAASAAGEVWFGTDATLPRDGYSLSVKNDRVEIKTSSFGGELYALQTLMQLLPGEFFAKAKANVVWNIPVVEIKDKPQYEHRGFMMDVARHFFDKDEVMKVLDIMAFYKMNRLHWHLTDDQGWRIEIPEYPKLTEVGAVRAGSFTSNGDGAQFFDDTEYGRGMYFTLDDLREIVAYATERNIDILPEIDLPGHMVAAVASYPEFSCDPTKKYEVRIAGGISHDVLNVGKDEVIDFLKCVLGHVADVFPFPYIHLGGDECPTEQWAVNADCLRRVSEEGLSGVEELQSWLVEQLGTFLKAKGKDIVVWDEVLKNWNTKNTIKPLIMAWNEGGVFSKKAADLGFESILCPWSHMYIDFMQVPEGQLLVDEPYYGGWSLNNQHINTVEEVYAFNPVTYLGGLEDFCWGVQVNLWAETLNDNEELEYCLLPRMLALAENGWLAQSQKSWTAFHRRLQSHDEILDQLGYTYAKHYIEPAEYTAAEQAVMEAAELLAASIRGGVGYPAAAAYDALQTALSAGVADGGKALAEAIATYKAAPIVQPEAGKTYRILSASTYFKRQYEGSSMYQKGNGVNFHYTPQTEPEELWQFVPSGDGYILTNCYSKGQLTMGNYNTPITITNQGTAVRVDKATIATRNYTYIPGAVTISAVEGYSAAMTGSVKRLSAEVSNVVYAKDEAALCYNGTWRIEEVTDYAAWLEGLVKKCELIILRALPGEANQPTEEALAFLEKEIIKAGKETISAGAVTKAQYEAYVALYEQFQQMERTGVVQSISEDYYYYISNAYKDWTGKYAAYDAANDIVTTMAQGSADHFLWQVKKQPGGKVLLINKATGTAAYPASHDGVQAIKLGQDYGWTLEERTLENIATGICIIDDAGANSWYINPNAWQYILLKPFWAACVWTFQKTSVSVDTSIEDVVAEGTEGIIYDLHGRRVGRLTQPGVYICNGKKFVK